MAPRAAVARLAGPVLRDENISLVRLLRAAAPGASGAAISRMIGFDQALWSRVSRGHERFGANACTLIVARFPDLEVAVARYLADTMDPPMLRLLGEADRIARLIPPEQPIELPA